MILAIASGKGGTGKTTISTALAIVAKQKVNYFDCDVEEPNGMIFLKPISVTSDVSFSKVPQIDTDKCTGCGECESFCQFNAIITLAGRTMVMNEMCHACTGCSYVCPKSAISFVPFRMGEINKGMLRTSSGSEINIVSGVLDIGRTMSPPLIRQVKKDIQDQELNIIDCPPGSSCPMLTAVDGADYVILVTEPTPFGLHDLSIAVDTLRVMHIPFGVIINKSGIGDSCVVDYCQNEGIDILAQIDSMIEVAKQYSEGVNILAQITEVTESLKKILEKITAGYCEGV